MSSSFQLLLHLAKSIIESMEFSDDSLVSDDTFSKLQAVFSDEIILSALNIIDQENIVHYKTPWGHSEYEIMGSADTNTIFLDLFNPKIPYSCSCPAFVSLVLISRTHIMCKHVLAAMIARKMKLCIERPIVADDLATLYDRNCSLLMLDKESETESE